ncbi:MAG: hypothetical protein K2K75_00545 [Muribaculaceae bacterium]|nr:hypothetical protein [Muribaculaceae bacterium]
MDNLKGKTILIGKEPGQGRLLVAIQETGKCCAIGAPGSVPACVSRCKPAEGSAHAKIAVGYDGCLTLTNMKAQNVTFVNGSEIAFKRISLSNSVELGKDHYSINVPAIIESAGKIASLQMQKDVKPNPQSHPQPNPQPSEKKIYNISHLEHVWNDLQAKKKEIQAKQKKINLVRSGCGVFTMCAMPCIFLFGPIGYVLTGIGILGNVYSFVGLKNDDTAEVVEKLNEDFQDRYVCPNPDCNKFLGNMSYRLLKKQYSMHCPYCKSEFVEK